MTYQKKPHVHAEMIKAKADDVSLVVFQKIENTSSWFEVIKNDDFFHKFSNYFLCLPKHKESVLNMLNGGGSQIKPSQGWIDAIKGDVKKWEPEFWYMLDDWESRIKPKKQKRWIGVFRNDTGFMQNTETSYESIEELKSSVYAPHGFANWQFIEIEFEV